MAPQKRKQTYRRNPRRVTPSDQGASADRFRDATAHELGAAHSVEELRNMLTAAQEAFNLADREAQEQPSPSALHQYRLASTSLGDAQRALEFASRSPAE